MRFLRVYRAPEVDPLPWHVPGRWYFGPLLNNYKARPFSVAYETLTDALAAAAHYRLAHPRPAAPCEL
jgi:hypothetical protein